MIVPRGVHAISRVMVHIISGEWHVRNRVTCVDLPRAYMTLWWRYYERPHFCGCGVAIQQYII